MKVDNEGKKYPSNVPATIQTPTYNERYLLKKSSSLSVFLLLVLSSDFPFDLPNNFNFSSPYCFYE
jgi:hypothetical protein